MKNCWIVLAALLLLTPCFAEIKGAVKTEGGMVSGVAGVRDANITSFKGIPYAEPPIGNLRWTAPRPARSWKGVRQADNFGDSCAQTFPKAAPSSENCLYLNIWTPSKSGADRLPVMFWIHGGGFFVGSPREDLYDGEELAKKGVVVVTVNYRLGVFGFFAHPELTKESPQHSSGNYGLLDQLAALQWVHRNIAPFGGDPNKVTIFGESAGAFSVNALVASPLSKGFFRAAISESGGVGAGFGRTGMPSLEESEKNGVKFAESVGAHSLAELRDLPTDKLLQSRTFPQATVDGWYFPESPATLFKQGKENKVPVLLGSNSDEGQHFIRSVLSASDYTAKARKDFGNDADEFLKLYPADSGESAKVSQQREFSDRTALATENLAGDLARGGAKAYLYYFAYQDGGAYDTEAPTLGLRLGADHGAELWYVFGVLNHWKRTVPEYDLKMQNTVMSYWTNFAKTLDPNGTGLPEWKPVGQSNDQVMVLDKTVGMEQHPRAAQLDFLQVHPTK
jgi:para-nitrobenzyl esterase